jgi:hypothetical protein
MTGTWRRVGVEVKGQQENGVCIQLASQDRGE